MASDTTVDLSTYAEDGVRDNPLSLEARVPIIRTAYPRWNYITAIVMGFWDHIVNEPTDDEVRMVGSFHEEYLSHWYGPPHTGWRARDMDKRPFDIDGGANGICFTKWNNGGWGYRRRTWCYGPPFVPTWEGDPQPLVRVMDRVHSIGDEVHERWLTWKRDHPEIFGGVSGGTDGGTNA